MLGNNSPERLMSSIKAVDPELVALKGQQKKEEDDHKKKMDEQDKIEKHRMRTSIRAPKFDTADEKVTFLLSPTEEVRYVHLSVAVAHSPVLRAALTDEWKDSASKSFPLPETTAKAFASLMQYFYSSTIAFIHGPTSTRHHEESGDDSPAHNKACTEKNLALVQLWVLADYLQIKRVCNLAVTQLMRSTDRCTSVTKSADAGMRWFGPINIRRSEVY